MNDLVVPQSFPENDYTPHGYLDNPMHTLCSSGGGVLRSVPPLGFGFWRSSFKGCYGGGSQERVNYLSLMNMAVAVDDLRLATSADFISNRIPLGSRYHTTQMMSYDWICAGLVFSLKYFLSRESALFCRIEVHNTQAIDRMIVLHATNIYGLWNTRWWGSDGVAARYVREADCAVSTIWAYGDYFVLGSDMQSVAHKATASEREWQGWLHENDLSSNNGASVRGPGPLHAVMSYKLAVPATESVKALIGLVRGANETWALEEFTSSLDRALPTLELQLDEDEAFWSSCPLLEGDWPEIWKRGWVYDFETVRMVVRPPAGLFAHHWDGMQIHAPRSVLAETAVDMLALHYADIERAKEVMLGVFADAPAPNVPCVREDGTMNMIAADGMACGTAPSWCFPFHVIKAIYAATGDDQWITALYPLLKAYLEWWFEHRLGTTGYFHCKCDWESGQDGSRRFPAREGGIAESVGAVDVEAGVAEALKLMAHFSEVADAPEDTPRWKELAEQRTKVVRDMFDDGWFRDVDIASGKPIVLDYQDIMMIAPLTCGVATAEQIAAVKPALARLCEQSQVWLEWPSFTLAFVEAAWTAQARELAAEAIADIAERVYARTDAREVRLVDKGKPYAWRIPGVANEYWPVADDVEPGGEAYGWGGTLPAQIIRGIIGFREPDALCDPADTDVVSFMLAPAIPQRLAATGKKYTITNLAVRRVNLALTCEILDLGRVRVTLNMDVPASCTLLIRDLKRGPVSEEDIDTSAVSVAFDGLNGAVYEVLMRFKPD